MDVIALTALRNTVDSMLSLCAMLRDLQAVLRLPKKRAFVFVAVFWCPNFFLQITAEAVTLRNLASPRSQPRQRWHEPRRTPAERKHVTTYTEMT